MKTVYPSIIVPCFNEEDTIGSCLDRLSSSKFLDEIVVVDDGSTDGTAQIVRQKTENFNMPVKLIRLRHNYGKGKALSCGIDVANGKIIIIHDADMIVQPKTLEDLYHLIKNDKADVVIGSRFIYPWEKGAIRKGNLIGNKLLALSFSFLMGQRITDVLCGLKIFRKTDFLKMGPKRCRWGDLDILIGSKKLGLRVVEIPIPYFKRRGNISKMRPFYDTYLFAKHTIRAFYELRIKFFWYRVCKR